VNSWPVITILLQSLLSFWEMCISSTAIYWVLISIWMEAKQYSRHTYGCP
jgi:hypothetical protein